MPVEAARLRTLGLFAALDDEDRQRVAEGLEIRRVPAGTTLAVEGTAHAGLAILLAGEALVTRRVDGRVQDLARLVRGATIGELSLLDPSVPASATVTVTCDAEVVVPTGPVDELRSHPVLGPGLEAIARRRRMSNHVATLGPVHLTLPSGVEIDLRPLWPDDWHLMDAARERTSTASLHQRFFTVPKLNETTLRRMATVDFVDHFAWVALSTAPTSDPSDDLLGVARYARLHRQPDTAEIALLVADDQQRKGLGRALLVALAIAAEEHGITTFEAVALATNTAVQRMLVSAGATWSRGADPTTVEARWPVGDVVDRLGGGIDLAAIQDLVQRALGGG